MRHAKLLLAHGCLMLAWAVPACAATAQASFGVQIQLKSGPSAGVAGGVTAGVGSGGYCINEVLSQQTHAVVTVVCDTNRFVSIEAQPGQPFVGTHGGAYRFFLGSGTLLTRNVLNTGDAAWRNDYGTSTSLQIFFADGMQELLIIF